MRLIKMAGGLGNQMFIYAMYLSMHKRLERAYVLTSQTYCIFTLITATNCMTYSVCLPVSSVQTAY